MNHPPRAKTWSVWRHVCWWLAGWLDRWIGGWLASRRTGQSKDNNNRGQAEWPSAVGVLGSLTPRQA